VCFTKSNFIQNLLDAYSVYFGLLDIMLGNQGALGATFILSRYAQAASMIAIIGMTSNFIAEMIQASMVPSEVLVGTLSVVRIEKVQCFVIELTTISRSVLPHCIAPSLSSSF